MPPLPARVTVGNEGTHSRKRVDEVRVKDFLQRLLFLRRFGLWLRSHMWVLFFFFLFFGSLTLHISLSSDAAAAMRLGVDVHVATSAD